MKKLSFIEWFNIIFFICAVVSDALYMFINCSQYITKTIASAIFVIGGLVNLIYVLNNKENFSEHKYFKYFMFLGLVSAFLGDILLIDYFTLGVAFFALGHVFYFVSFCTIQKIHWLDFVIGGTIFALSTLLILLYKGFDFKGMKLLIIVYALIISFMVGKTISNYILNKNMKNLALIVGSAMFFLSDLMLLFRLFANTGRVFSILCLILYYPAQFVLSTSIYSVSIND